MLEDNSPMPFGKHKNKPMEEVPASYLLWLWDELDQDKILNKHQKAVQDYVKDNWDVLNKEVDE